MTLQMLEKELKHFENPVDNPLLKWLYIHLPPKLITSRKMHLAYVESVSFLMKQQENGTLDKTMKEAIGEYLEAILPFIEAYEKKEYPVGAATPEEILKFLMEEKGLIQYDIGPDLGGQPVVSNILQGKRKLTREQIERLSRRFNTSPASFFGQNAL